MSSMRKSDLVLAALSGLFILAMTTLHYGNKALERELAASNQQCQQRIERVRGNYRAEIDDLLQYLRIQYDFMAADANTQPRQDRKSQQPPAEKLDPEQAMHRKYHYMYEQMDYPEPVKEMLRQLLLEREQLAATGVMSSEQTGAIDAQIGELLGSEGYQDYQILRESDAEQHHLREFAASLSESAPLSEEQERSLLFAKLRHKQNFQRALHDTGFYQQNLGEEGRAYARNGIIKALDEYKYNYLNEARSLLNSEQFTKLRNYESTEFNWEQQRLLRQIDAKPSQPHHQ